MIVLDTNVISEVMRAEPAPVVLDWLDGQLDNACFITSITAAELRYGVARLPDGRRKVGLAQAVSELIEIDFSSRILAFDEIAAEHFADIATTRERAGRPISQADAQIAAICRSHAATLATRNIRDFADIGLDLIDPWQQRPR